MDGLETIDFTPPTTSCYNLVNCDTGAVDYVINSATNVILSEYVNQYVSQVVIDGTPFTGCWQIVAATTCENLRTEPFELNYFSSSEEQANFCGCPTGSTYEPISGLCKQIVIQQPEVLSTPLQTTAGGVSSDYGNQGTAFFPNITSLTKPLYDVDSGPLFPTPVAYLYDGDNNLLTPTIINAAPWNNATFARLNNIGIWVPSSKPICDKWIGISTCLEVPTTGTYCIGIAGDNRVRLKIDGYVILSIENSGYTYRTWNVFEIQLTQGTHIIQLEGWNNKINDQCLSSNAAAIGAEIYQATSAALQAMLNEAAIDAVTIFSTEDYRSGGEFNVGTYTCGDGFALNTCDEPICQQILTVPQLPCCYNLVNCDTQEVDYQLSYTGASLPGVPLPNQIVSPAVINYIRINDGTVLTGCWSLERAQCDTIDYNWEIISEITTLTDCETCSPSCYVLEDCKAIQPAITVSFPNLNAYDGKIIGFEIVTPVEDGWPIGKYCATVSTTKTCIDTIALNIINIVEYETCLKCAPPCYLLTDCSNPNNTMVVSGDLSQYVGGVINLAGCNTICWIVSYADDCTGSVPSPPVANFYPAVGNLGDKCCYTYGKISGFEGKITINGTPYNLTSTTLIDIVNEITALGFGVCTISNPGDITNFGAVICIVGNNTYGPLTYNSDTETTSQYCQYNSVLKYCNYTSYQLFLTIPVKITVTINGISYVSPVTATVTGFEIVDYLNSLGLGTFSISFSGLTPPILATIYVEGINNYGTILIENALTGEDIATLTIDECTNFVNTAIPCEACTPDPPAPTPFTLHTRKVKPGYDTKGCPPEYTEKVLCNFAEQAFDEMAKARYGIKICCEHDFDYWDIKKQILELKALYDENVCHVQFPCICYSLSNADPINSTIFNYSNCSGKYLTIEVTNSDGIVKVCATNLPVGMGGTPTVVQGALCQDETCL